MATTLTLHTLTAYCASFSSAAACDVTGTTCLHRVAFLGHSEVGELLISGGCPVDAVNKDGDAAIHIAAREVSRCPLQHPQKP